MTPRGTGNRGGEERGGGGGNVSAPRLFGGDAVDSTTGDMASPVSPLESFLREYLETTGGVWDEIEPQVYDVLLPAGTLLPAATEGATAAWSG